MLPPGCGRCSAPHKKQRPPRKATGSPVHSHNIPISNEIKSLLLSQHHSTSALVSEILMSVLQTVQKTTIYIWTVHIYRLYRRQCAKYTYIYSVHIVYYKEILNFQTHYTPYGHIYIMYTIYTLCSLYIVIM